MIVSRLAKLIAVGRQLLNSKSPLRSIQQAVYCLGHYFPCALHVLCRANTLTKADAFLTPSFSNGKQTKAFICDAFDDVSTSLTSQAVSITIEN